jgi:hypothetical protein
MAANSSDDVATLEREVEEARERLAGTIAKLSDPETQAAMKNEVMEYVQGYKDQLLDGARGTRQGVVADLKQRAMNNPLGVAMIGAGIAYRLYRHPPITTLLVGAGAALLARSRGRKQTARTAYRAPYDREQPRGYVPGGVAGYGYPVEEDAPGSTTTDRMMAAAAQAGEKAREMGMRARDAAYQAGSEISETAERSREAGYDIAERARETAYDTYERARSSAQHTLERTRSTAQDGYERTRSAVQDSYEHATERVGSAAHEMRERAGGAYESVRTSPLALGALGILAGAAIGHALRSTETGDRVIGASADMMGRGASRIGASARNAARRAAETASDMASSAAAVASDYAGSAAEMASSAVSGMAESFSGDRDEDAGRSSRGSGRRASRGRRRGDRDEGLMSSVTDGASTAYRTAAEQAEYARRRGADLSRQAAGQIGEFARNYPLLLGAIGVALGAAAGLAMRPTQSEDELIGPYSDALKARAREMAAEQYEEALGAAEELAKGLRKPGDGPGQYGAADWETVVGGGAPSGQARPNARPSPGEAGS